MLSLAFWLSLVAVFWGVKWLAEGLMSLGDVEIRRAQPAVAQSSTKSAEARPWRETPVAPARLDRAA